MPVTTIDPVLLVPDDPELDDPEADPEDNPTDDPEDDPEDPVDELDPWLPPDTGIPVVAWITIT